MKTNQHATVTHRLTGMVYNGIIHQFKHGGWWIQGTIRKTSNGKQLLSPTLVLSPLSDFKVVQ